MKIGWFPFSSLQSTPCKAAVPLKIKSDPYWPIIKIQQKKKEALHLTGEPERYKTSIKDNKQSCHQRARSLLLSEGTRSRRRNVFSRISKSYCGVGEKNQECEASVSAAAASVKFGDDKLLDTEEVHQARKIMNVWQTFLLAQSEGSLWLDDPVNWSAADIVTFWTVMV
jgi:hypothetical protein